MAALTVQFLSKLSFQEYFLEEALEHSGYMQRQRPELKDGDSLAQAYLQVTDQEHVDVHLLVAMVDHILQTSRDGAVLVFLPG